MKNNIVVSTNIEHKYFSVFAFGTKVSMLGSKRATVSYYPCENTFELMETISVSMRDADGELQEVYICNRTRFENKEYKYWAEHGDRFWLDVYENSNAEDPANL